MESQGTKPNEQTTTQLTPLPAGFHTGLLTKEGAFVKNWKERFFCLTWAFLTYYDPLTREPLDNIALNQCTDVQVGVDSKPYSFKLLTVNRTYIFLTNDLRDRATWIKYLRAIINMHNPKSHFAKYEEIEQVALHFLRTLRGLTVLKNTHKQLCDQIGLVANSFFGVLEAYAKPIDPAVPGGRLQGIQDSAQIFQTEFGRMKTMIPLPHRFQPEDPNFDIAWEQRQINSLLYSITKEIPPEEKIIPQEIPKDLHPHIVALVKQCFVIGQPVPQLDI